MRVCSPQPGRGGGPGASSLPPTLALCAGGGSAYLPSQPASRAQALWQEWKLGRSFCAVPSAQEWAGPGRAHPPPPTETPPLPQLPWKSLTSIIEYYYMWKTTDRYVQQVRASWCGRGLPSADPAASL